MPMDFSRLTPDVFLGLGTGLLSGGTWNQQLASAALGANSALQANKAKQEETALQNKTIDLLNQQAPDLAAAVQNKLMTPTDAYKMWYAQKLEQQQLAEKRKLEAERPKNDWLNAGDGVFFNKDTQEFKTIPSELRTPKSPALGQEYEYAKSNGFQGSFQDYQAWKAGLNKSGFMVEQDKEGFRVVQGDITNSPKKLTEGQSKDISWLSRGTAANDKLAPLESQLSSPAGALADKIGAPGNYLKSDEYQRAEQAGKEFLAVILRKDTGAAITAQEMDQYGKIYLPQPGDTPETIAAKKLSRENALEAIRLGLGGLAPKDDSSLPDPLGIRNK